MIHGTVIATIPIAAMILQGHPGPSGMAKRISV
jgi:hypothetical protein